MCGVSESISQPVTQIDEFKKHLSDQGFFPPEIPVDQTKIYRFSREGKRGKRNAWLVAFSNFQIDTGKEYLVAVFGDWSTGEEFTFKSGDVNFSAQDKQVIDKQIRERKIKAEREKFLFQKETQKEAIDLLQYAHNYASDRVKPRGMETGVGGDGDVPDFCPYLIRKGFEKGVLFGAALYRGPDDKPCTIVPMRDSNGTLWGLQRIYSDGAKFFLSGQRVDGLFHVIGDEIKTGQEGMFTLCEGFATGASIHLATGRKVVVCFTANNLEKVAQILKKENPDAGFLICGDDDRFNLDKEKNPGREAAERAAIRTLGKAVYPSFTWGNDTGTDFNDLHLESGLEAVKAQIEAVKIAQNYVRCLGHNQGDYYFSSSSNQEVVTIRSFNKDTVFNLMPKEYWEIMYPKKTDGKGKNQDDGAIDWLTLGSELQKKCRERGIFKQENLRFHGVWMDHDRVIIHLGNRLLLDGREMGLHEVKNTQFQYGLCETKESVHSNPLTAAECRPIVEFLERELQVRTRQERVFLGGWIVAGLLGGILEWRPHLFMSAEAGSGKSYLRDNLLIPFMQGFYEESASSATTEPGTRQMMNGRATPVLFDEMDNIKPEASESLLSLLRQAATGNSKIVKGGANSKHVEFYPRFSAILLGIQNPSVNRQADATRFLQIEIKKPSDTEQLKRANAYFEKFRASDYSKRFISRVFNCPRLFNKNFVKIKNWLLTKHNARFVQLHAPVLTGWSILLSDEELNQTQVEDLCAILDEENNKQQIESDHVACVNFCLDYRLPKDGFIIGALIRAVRANECAEMGYSEATVATILASYGICYLRDQDSVFFHMESPQLKSIYQRTDWQLGYKELYKRFANALESVQHRLNGGKKRGYTIPYIQLFD